MSQALRQPEILDILRAEGKATVDGLAERFGVTVQTIRRDLAEMAEAGLLERVHGGAVPPSGVANIHYEERRALNPGPKAAIGRACAAQIPEGASIFLNIGTSTEAAAQALLTRRNLMAVTNNMNVARILSANPDCEIVLTAGRLRRSDGGLIGDLTVETIERFRFDIAVIGCSALSEEGEILDFDLAEVSVSRAILRHARQVFLVADHSKFQRRAPVRIGRLSAVSRFFTDRPLPPALAERCAEWGVEVTVV